MNIFTKSVIVIELDWEEAEKVRTEIQSTSDTPFLDEIYEGIYERLDTEGVGRG